MINKYSKLLAILLALFFVVSCSDDDTNDPTIDESQVLAEYIESTSDYVNTYAPAMIGADEVNTLNNTGEVYIIDIRSGTDFANGHIKNAVNVAFADLLTHIKTVDMTKYTKVAIVCYSGQTASYGTGLLRLLGYDKVYTLKFGMCSWNEATASGWKNGIKNDYASQFTAENTPKAAAGAMPLLETGLKTGKEILEARVNACLAEGFTTKVTSATVFGALSSYYIVNYWPAAQYSDPEVGHIPGATQYTPKADLKLSTFLKTLPTDKKIAVYCYTGQTSAHIAAFLRVLGYDVYSILYGTNGMIYNKMDGKTGYTVWHDSYIMGYELVK